MRVLWLVLCELGYSNNPALIDRIVKGLIVHHTWNFVPVPTNFGFVVLDPQNGVCFKRKQTILETVSNQRILNGWLTVNYSPSLDCYFDALSGACISSSVSSGVPDCDYPNLLILPPDGLLSEAKLISMTDATDLSVIEHEFLDLDPCVLESNITSLGKAIVIESLLALQNVSWPRCNLSAPFSDLATFDGSSTCWSDAITSTINFLESNTTVVLKTPMSPDVCFFEPSILDLEDFSQGLLVFNRTVAFPEISAPVPFAFSPVDPATCQPLRGNPVSCSELDTWSCDAVEGCYIDWSEYVCADTLPGFFSTSMSSVSPCNPILESQRYTAIAWTSPDCPFKCMTSSEYVVDGQCVPIPSKGWYVGVCDDDNTLHACSDNLEIIEFPVLGSCQNAYYRYILKSPPIPIICVWIKTEAVPVTVFGGIDRWSFGITEEFKFVLTNTTSGTTVFSDNARPYLGEEWVFIIFDGHKMYVNGKSVNFSDFVDLQIDKSDMFYGPSQPSKKFEILGPFQLRLNEITEDIATEIFNSIEAPSGFIRTSTSEHELLIIPTFSEEPNHISTTTNLPESTAETYTTTDFLTAEMQTNPESTTMVTTYTYSESSTTITADYAVGSWSEGEMSTTTPGTEQAQSTTIEMYPSSAVTDNESFSTEPINSLTSRGPYEPSTTSADSTSTDAEPEIATTSTSQSPTEDLTTSSDFTTTSRDEETITTESSTTAANDESIITAVYQTTEENGGILTTETPLTSITTFATLYYPVTTETPSATQVEETATSAESSLDSSTNYVTAEPTNPPTDQPITTTNSPDSTTSQSGEELVFTTESAAYTFEANSTTAPASITTTNHTETNIPESTVEAVESTIAPESSTTTTVFTTITVQENILSTETDTTTEFAFPEMEVTYDSTLTGSIVTESSTTTLSPETASTSTITVCSIIESSPTTSPAETGSTTTTTAFTTIIIQENIPSTETELTTTSPSTETSATEAKSTSTTTEFLTTETEEYQTTTTGFEEYHSSANTTYVSTSTFGPVDEELDATTEGPTSNNVPFTTDHFGSSETTAMPQPTNRPNEYANNSTNNSRPDTTTDIPPSSEVHSSDNPGESSQPVTTTVETHATTFETSTSPPLSSDRTSTQTPYEFMPTTTPLVTTFLLGQTTTESFPETYPQIIQSSPSGHELQFGDPLVANSYHSEPSWLPISCITASIAVVIAVASSYVSALSRRRMTHQIQQVINAEP